MNSVRDTLRTEGYNLLTYLEEARECITTFRFDDSFYEEEGRRIYPKYVLKKLSLKFDDPLVFATDEAKKWKEEYKKFLENKELVEKSTITDKTDFEKKIKDQKNYLAFNAPMCPPGLLSLDEMTKIFEILNDELEMEWDEDLYFGVKEYLEKYELYKSMLN